MRIEFCEHGNVIGLDCSKCNPNSPNKKNTIKEGIDCPVWRLSKSQCDNEGVSRREHSARQFVLECTSCGWEWRQWKKSGDNLSGTMPKIVECGICNETSIEKESRSSDVTCSTCGRAWFRENKPNLVRD